MKKFLPALMLLALVGWSSCGGELVCEADDIGSVTVTNGTDDINMQVFFGGRSVIQLPPQGSSLIDDLAPGTYEVYGKEVNAIGPKEYPTGRKTVTVKQCEDTPAILE